ncbi:MAG: AAA family ATPase [Maioricimonas sp. JB049]
MGTPLDKLTIDGFKSIEHLEMLELERLNVLIGANGAGKSNFVDFFRMLRAFADGAFQQFINAQGGGDGLLYLGPKVTSQISGHLEFGLNAYEFELAPTAAGTLQLTQERAKYLVGGSFQILSSGALESGLRDRKDDVSPRTGGPGVPHYVYQAISSWTVYHFHDTGALAPMRRDQPLRDWSRLRHDASNVAPFLLHLQETDPGTYELIRDTVRMIAPFFDDFLFRPQTRGGDEQVRLEWNQKGSDFPFQPHHLSDGTIRFICLATALLEPAPPATIVIDEPELGLHPYAISVLASLIRSSAERTQVIISTQSPPLLDYFEPHEILVANRTAGRSTFERLDATSLTEWIDDYSVGELWQKNVVRGGPTVE